MTPRRCLQPPAGAAAARAAAMAALVPVIETPRLRLRAPSAADFPVWAAIFAGPDSDYTGGRRSLEEAWEEFSVYVASWVLHGHGIWAVEPRDGGPTLGFVLAGLEWSDVEPELGWMFAPEARGQGYATEAAAAVLAAAPQAFGRLGLVSYIHPDNAASARLAGRLGAARDGTAEAALGDGTQVWRHGARP